MGRAASRSSCPRSARRWSSPRTTRARRTRPTVLRRALQEPVARAAAARAGARGIEGRDLDVRRHPRPAARQDDPGRPGRARRARLRRRDPGRHRHPSRQHRRGDPGDARRRHRRPRARRQPRRPRQVDARLPRRARQRRPGVDQPRVGRGRPADHDRLRRAALLRRLQRRAEARHARPGGPGDRAGAAQRGPDRRPEGHLGRDRGQPGARGHPRRVRRRAAALHAST